MRAALVALLLLACTEPGFMPTRPAFDRRDVPLVVCAVSYAGDYEEGARKMAKDALATLNRRLGFDLFAFEGDAASACDIAVTIGVPSEAGYLDPGGDASFDPARTANPRCVVRTVNTGTDELLAYTLQHELGHCAGLAHDPWIGSIMRRVQTPTPVGSWPPWLSDADRALLRETYGP